MKAINTDPKQTDEDNTESMNMEEFNYDPASDLEHTWNEMRGDSTLDICNDNTKNIVELYKNCESLDAILNRRFASSTREKSKKPALLVLYTLIHMHEWPKSNAKAIKILLNSSTNMTLKRRLLIKKIWLTKTGMIHWRTRKRNFHTEYRNNVQVLLPKFSD